MRVVLVTSLGTPFLDLFLRGYADGGGNKLERIVFCERREHSKFWNSFQSKLVSLLTLGPGGVLLALRSVRSVRPMDYRNGRFGLCAGQYAKSVETLGEACSESLFRLLEADSFDVLASVGAPFVFHPKILRLARIDAVNIHNANIEKYRGKFGTFWEFYCKEMERQVTLHRMAPVVDNGAILLRRGVSEQYSKSFLNTLLEKKYLGGRMLGEFVKDVREGESLDSQAPVLGDYFGFPTIREATVLKLRGFFRFRGHG